MKDKSSKDLIDTLADFDADLEDDLDEEIEADETRATFTCPECGVIPREEVLFICNNCESNEVIIKDGIHVCPQCFYPGDNFECMRCGNKKVVAKFS